MSGGKTLILTAYVLAALCAQHRPWEPEGVSLPLYTPPSLPTALKGRAPLHRQANEDSIRGYRTITTTWIVKGPFQDLWKALDKETSPSFSWIRPAGGKPASNWCHRTMDDRVQIARAQPGRMVMREGPGSRDYGYEDESEFTTVFLTERPFYAGPMPKDWPNKATAGIHAPKEAKFPPLSGNQREPDMCRTLLASAASGYEMTWFVQEPIETAFPRFKKELEKQGNWTFNGQPNKVPTLRDSVRAVYIDLKESMSDRKPGFRSIVFHASMSNSPDFPKNWCRVTAQWYPEVKWKITKTTK